MKVVVCKICGNPQVVNKHFELCQLHNELRLNGGKTKAEVMQEKVAEQKKGLAKSLLQYQSDVRKRNEERLDVTELKKRYSIAKVSNKSKYNCSDGTVLSQHEVNSRYAATCDRIKQERPPVCQGTGRTDLPLSFSHTISRRRCKELGKAELICDSENLEIESFEAPTSFPDAAHNIWEVGSLDKKKTLLNFTRKLEYIKKHDPETYRKLTN